MWSVKASDTKNTFDSHQILENTALYKTINSSDASLLEQLPYLTQPWSWAGVYHTVGKESGTASLPYKAHPSHQEEHPVMGFKGKMFKF